METEFKIGDRVTGHQDYAMDGRYDKGNGEFVSELIAVGGGEVSEIEAGELGRSVIVRLFGPCFRTLWFSDRELQYLRKRNKER